MTTLFTMWRCIPCGATSNVASRCYQCGRLKTDATDERRWSRFFALDAVIVDEECEHAHVQKDDDGRDNWFYVCDDCDKVVHLEADEDGLGYWEAIE